MAEKYKGKHKKEDLLKECPSHGSNVVMTGSIKRCGFCKKPVL